MDSYLERLRREIDNVLAGTNAGDLAKAPPGKWNAAQILEHLYLTYRGTNRGLEKCLVSGTLLAAPVKLPPKLSAQLKDRFATFLVVNLGYIPEGRKAPERAIPRGMPVEEVENALAAELQQLGLALNECERKFGTRAKVMDHPFLGPLTAQQWRKFHWVHGRHHIRQIRQRMGKS
jgi:hypothetical protein